MMPIRIQHPARRQGICPSSLASLPPAVSTARLQCNSRFELREFIQRSVRRLLPGTHLQEDSTVFTT